MNTNVQNFAMQFRIWQPKIPEIPVAALLFHHSFLWKYKAKALSIRCLQSLLYKTKVAFVNYYIPIFNTTNSD
jgi:hypothetical protein